MAIGKIGSFEGFPKMIVHCLGPGVVIFYDPCETLRSSKVPKPLRRGFIAAAVEVDFEYNHKSRGSLGLGAKNPDEEGGFRALCI